jgi:hypothetical protein
MHLVFRGLQFEHDVPLIAGGKITVFGRALNRIINTVSIIEHMTVFLYETDICFRGGRGGIKTQIKR